MKKQRLLRSCWSLQPASVATFLAAECISSLESKTTPSSLNSVPLCNRRCKKWKDSLLGSNITWFAFPHKWTSFCAPFISISARNAWDILLRLKRLKQLKSSANTVSVKSSAFAALRASLYKQFHNGGPRTVHFFFFFLQHRFEPVQQLLALVQSDNLTC